MKLRINILIFLFISVQLLSAQILTPIKWSFDVQETGDNSADLLITANIDQNWHLYAQDMPEGGPISTSFSFDQLDFVELDGAVLPQMEKKTVFDNMFQMDLSYYEHSVVFIQKIKKLDIDKYAISGKVEFMACNNESCLPPQEVPFHFGLQEQVLTSTSSSLSFLQAAPVEEVFVDTWKPVIEEMKALGDSAQEMSDHSLWMIFLFGVIGGFIALLTPCVWPMIPMTVSFFLGRNKGRSKAIKEALIYGTSIVVIYLLLGFLITVLFGASALNDLSTNAIFNLLFFALLVVFSISFFGFFEITLPSSWINRMDAKAESSSYLLSIFFMAFTLVLVSFSCTGPIIGTLLVEVSTQESILAPMLGMFGFALALSIPFALFSIFPTWLKAMPKSGSWMSMVKVTLGFLELAFALKFFSIADLAYGWGILPRDVFIVIWVMIFAFMGLYYLRIVRFPLDKEDKKISVIRVLLALVSFSFVAYMLPGIWGNPLPAISAFTPPMETQIWVRDGHEPIAADFNDYDEAMEFAQEHHKPILLDFTGYGCVNCREMEATVLDDQRVKRLIEEHFIYVVVYVDDKKELPEPYFIQENGVQREISTYGAKWSYLQRTKFGANAQPYYVILDQQAMPISPSYTYSKDVKLFKTFLEDAQSRFK